DDLVTGVQTCALPILRKGEVLSSASNWTSACSPPGFAAVTRWLRTRTAGGVLSTQKGALMSSALRTEAGGLESSSEVTSRAVYRSEEGRVGEGRCVGW